ncbi:cytochrome C oxidase subunit I [Thermocrinis minervae]|uniref:Heme/copper-type cytochrome/quinol oxidase, subunit 1 n=1 Tax=Thermocrinis minervae TaxID=381751 RepID=A0A1M6S2L2_9AQUI|nr:cytochrome C oxidase subunit I [Thermocrinis minervae]SHK38911.1 Heme/copper-type cytochrome/quinol oxidase, subunit 1 [Thermocrinis minervae]
MERKLFLLAITSLGVGGFLAFVVAMARTPGVYKYFPPNYFYHALVGHVDLAIVVFLLTFTMVLWQRYYQTVPRFSYYLALAGFFLIAAAALAGQGKAVSNNYLPTIVHPLFFLGAGSFFAGFWIATLSTLPRAMKDISSTYPEKHTLSLTVALSFLMLVAFLLSTFKTGSHDEVYLFYERLYWAPGHIHQYINGALLLFCWYYLSKKDIKIDKLRWVSVSFLLFGSLLALVPVLFQDPVSREAKVFTEVAYAVGLGIPMFVHAFFILKEAGLKPEGLHKTGLLLSMSLYFLGIAIAYMGFGQDLRVPAHYHGAVTSLTLSLMILSYDYLVGEGKRIKLSLSKLQTIMYGVGMILFVLGLYFAGKRHAPRKTYGTAYTDDPFVLFSLALMGVGTLLAVISGIIFVVYVLKKSLEVSDHGR